MLGSLAFPSGLLIKFIVRYVCSQYLRQIRQNPGRVLPGPIHREEEYSLLHRREYFN